MTSIRDDMKKCALCGRVENYPRPAPINAFEAPDLDTRSSQIQQSAMESWLQECPSCGYIAVDIARGPGWIRAIVGSQEYKARRTDDRFPSLANRFLCAAHIEGRLSLYSHAGWHCVNAAWVCDDQNMAEAASACRERAIAFFIKARENQMSFAQPQGAEKIILADLYRRAEMFDEALAECQGGALESETDRISKALKFEIELVNSRDSSCHGFDEIIA